VPGVVPKIMQSGDAAAIERLVRAIMPMTRLDVAKIEEASRPE
jgi:hypothetical protein